MYFFKKTSQKTISKILLFVFVIEPVFILGIFKPVSAQTNNSAGFNQAFNNYDGISQWGNLDIINNPAIGSALRSCLRVVPSFTKKIKRVYGSSNAAGAKATLNSARTNGITSFCTADAAAKWATGEETGTGSSTDGYMTDEDKKRCIEENDQTDALSKQYAEAQGDESIKTEDTTAIKLLEEIKASQNEIETKVTSTNTNLDETKVREECMDSIAYSMTKTLLAGVTEGTVNLINTGNFGDPFYVKNTKTYFEDLDKVSLRQVFGSLLESTNQATYPFLKDTYRNLVNQNVPTPFQDRARFTLDQILSGQAYDRSTDPYGNPGQINSNGSLVEAFKRDFSVGGWNGWLGLTQYPQNNPIGFAILAQTELSKTQTIAKEQAKDELDQSGGFLSMRKCTEEYVPPVYDQATNKLTTGAIRTRGIKVGPDDPNCRKSEVTTPGAILASRLDAVITSDVRQLELSDRFNESLNLIFTSAFNKLTAEGLSSLSTKVYGSWASQTKKQSFIQRYNSSITQVGGINASNNGNVELIYRRVDSSYSSYDFDITTDLFDQQVGCQVRPGILSIEKNYLLELKRANNSSSSPLYKLMPAMAELDFCIPGPTTNWEEITDRKYIELIENIETSGIGFNPNSVVPASFYSEIGEQIGKIEKAFSNRQLARQSTQTAVGVAGGAFVAATFGISAVVAGIVNAVLGFYNNRDQKKTQAEMEALNSAAGALNDAIPQAFEEEGREWAVMQLDYLKEDYANYKKAVYDKFQDSKNIPVASVARPFIKDLPTYAVNLYSIQSSYDEEIAIAEQVIAELQLIHDAVKKIKDAATARAVAQGLPTTVPKECKPATNQCPKPSAVSRYLITADPTAYSSLPANTSYAVDQRMLGAIYNNSGTSSSPSNPNAVVLGNLGSLSSAGGYQFPAPIISISNFYTTRGSAIGKYNVSFNIDTDDFNLSVKITEPFGGSTNSEVYGQKNLNFSNVSGTSVDGKKMIITATNPNGKSTSKTCTVKIVNSSTLTCN